MHTHTHTVHTLTHTHTHTQGIDLDPTPTPLKQNDSWWKSQRGPVDVHLEPKRFRRKKTAIPIKMFTLEHTAFTSTSRRSVRPSWLYSTSSRFNCERNWGHFFLGQSWTSCCFGHTHVTSTPPHQSFDNQLAISDQNCLDNNGHLMHKG